MSRSCLVRVGKAATTLGRLATRVWENPKLTTKTKMAVYYACAGQHPPIRERGMDNLQQARTEAK